VRAAPRPDLPPHPRPAALPKPVERQSGSSLSEALTTSSVDHSSSDRVEPFERTSPPATRIHGPDALADLRPLRQPAAAFRLRCPRPAFRGRARPRPTDARRRRSVPRRHPVVRRHDRRHDRSRARGAGPLGDHAGVAGRHTGRRRPDRPRVRRRRHRGDRRRQRAGRCQLIALLSTHHGRLNRYCGENLVPGPVVPVVALPIEPTREVLLDILERAHHGPRAVNQS
jgi:hypothetical protein